MLLSLIRSHLFCYYFHYLRRQTQKKHCYNLCQRVSCLCFPLGVVWFLLIFRALTHFEFTFAHGIRECSNFLFLQIAVQFPQHHLIDCPFSTVYSYLLCHRLIDYNCKGLLLGLLFCSVYLYVCLCTSTILF